MEELVKYIVEHLVENKEEIKVSSNVEGDTTVIKIVVADADMGKIIGRGGKIAQSIRTIVRTASIRSGVKYIVQIGEKA